MADYDWDFRPEESKRRERVAYHETAALAVVLGLEYLVNGHPELNDDECARRAKLITRTVLALRELDIY